MANSIPVGTIVSIRKGSRYYGQDEGINPADVPGVVVEGNEGRGLVYQVKWLHTEMTNSYSREDLRYWKGAYEHFRGVGVGGEELGAADPRPVKPKAPPKPKNRSEAIEAARKALHKSDKSHATARYAFVYANHSHLVNKNTACHSQVLNMDGEDKKKVVAIVTVVNRGGDQDRISDEKAIAYYDWLFKRSPWAIAFEEKDARAAHEEGTVVCRTDIAANMLQAALVATRTTWEHSHVVETWYGMVGLGIGEHLAFLLGSFLGRGDGEDVIVSPNAGGHFPLQAHSMDVNDAIGFCTNNPKGLNARFIDGGNSWGACDMFASNIQVAPFREVVERWFTNSQKTGGKGNNPFAAAKRTQRIAVKATDLARTIMADVNANKYAI